MTTRSDPAGEASPARSPAALWGILGGGFVVRLFLAFQNPQTLVTLNIPDDAFYYFKIAQNIAAGRGSSFDGIHPTNGYHPLWMGFLVPIFRLVPDQLELALRLGLIEQALLDLVTALLVYFLAQAMLSDRRWAVLACALYFLNPHTILYQMNGMETALSTLLEVVVLYFFVLLQAPSPGARLPYTRFAVACGLLLLARTDNVILCLVLFAALAWQEWKRHASLRGTFGMGLKVCAIVAPWLVWNYARFHQLVQVSGWAKPWVNRQEAGAAWIVRGLEFFRYETTVRWSQFSCLLAGYFVLWGIGWLMLKRRDTKPKDQIQERGLNALALAWLGLVLTLGFHCFVRLYPRPWYSAPFLVLNALSMAWAGRRISSLPKARRAVSVVLVTIFAAYIVSAVQFVWVRPRPWQGEMLRTARWINLHTPPSARVGSFNAGIIGFFAHRTVVNLDGVVNNSAFTALRARQLGDYLTANSIEYVTDFKYAVEVDYADFWGAWPDHLGLVPVASFPVGGAQFRDSFMQVYRVAPRSAPPASPAEPPPDGR
jgi:hypothetical protein